MFKKNSLQVGKTQNNFYYYFFYCCCYYYEVKRK